MAYLNHPPLPHYAMSFKRLPPPITFRKASQQRLFSPDAQALNEIKKGRCVYSQQTAQRPHSRDIAENIVVRTGAFTEELVYQQFHFFNLIKTCHI